MSRCISRSVRPFSNPISRTKPSIWRFDFCIHGRELSESADLRLFQTGGKMNEPAADATAFVHRNSRWLLDVGLNWSGTDSTNVVARSRQWQDRF